jgi:hypothetical protein
MIDGLRGIAAFSVLFFHVLWNSAGSDSLRGLLTAEGEWITGLLRSGVAVFFVISGFVIAHTTRNVRTFDQSWRFGAKRQLRLDPPYYAAMGVVLVIETVQLLVPGLVGRSFTVAEVALNMLYLQNIVGAPSVLAVAWTLCLEVQFYLVIILVAWTAARIARSDRTRTLLVVGGRRSSRRRRRTPLHRSGRPLGRGLGRAGDGRHRALLGVVGSVDQITRPDPALGRPDLILPVLDPSAGDRGHHRDRPEGASRLARRASGRRAGSRGPCGARGGGAVHDSRATLPRVGQTSAFIPTRRRRTASRIAPRRKRLTSRAGRGSSRGCRGR